MQIFRGFPISHKGFNDFVPEVKKTPEATKKQKSESLVAAAKRQGKRVLSDEMILEIRTLHEKHGMHVNKIVQCFHMLELTESQVYQVCNYSTRSHIVPK